MIPVVEETVRTLRHSKGDIPTKTMMRYVLVDLKTEEVLAQSDHIDLIVAMTQTCVAQIYDMELGAMTYVLDLEREEEPIRAYVKYNASFMHREEEE